MSEDTSWQNMLSSLRTKYFRRYLAAQQLSLVGVWLQATASTWLVLKLGGSAFDVGITAAFQFGPLLALAPYAGAMADRWPRRKIMMVTQTFAAVEAAVLAALALTHVVVIAEIWALAFLFGILDAFDAPARQGLLVDLSGVSEVVSATAWVDLAVTVSRIVGPALAGALIAWTGPGICYAIDAGSYVVVLASLSSMRLPQGARSNMERRPTRAGIRYVRSNNVILCVLVAVFLVGIFGFNSQVMFSALVRGHHHGAIWFGLINTAFGTGAVVGSSLIGRYRRVDARLPIGCAIVMTCALTLAAAAPAWGVIVLAIALLGLGGAAFLSASAGVLQVLADRAMRGRVMALFSSGFLGTSVIGGPLMGLVIEHGGVSVAFILAGIGCLAGAAIAFAILRLNSNGSSMTVESEPTG